MAVAALELTEGTDTDGNSTATTASITPTPGNLILLTVRSRTAITATPNVPSVTGNSLTYTEIANVNTDDAGSSRERFTLFRASGPVPTSGTIALDFGGQNQTHVEWVIDELSGVNVTTTDGVVTTNTGTNRVGSAGPQVTTLTATLPNAFASTANATYGVLCHFNSTATSTVGSGFAQVSFIQDIAGTIHTEFRNDNDTTVDFTFDLTESVGVIGIEINAKLKHLASLGAG